MTLKKIIPLFSTTQLAEVKGFYVEHFGFEVAFENDAYLGLRSTVSPALELGFMVAGGCGAAESAGVTLCLEVENADAECDRLKGAGLALVQPLKDNPWGDRSFIVADPIGTALYVHHPISPAPEFAKHYKA